jgi:hypothetical protein
MPICYHRDDARQLITVTVTGARSLEDILSVIDRQAAEGTWHYAVLYDLTGTHVGSDQEARRIRDHVESVGGGRRRGPIALAIAPHPAEFRSGSEYSTLAGRLFEVEVLLTRDQVDAWLTRWAGTVKSPNRA